MCNINLAYFWEHIATLDTPLVYKQVTAPLAINSETHLAIFKSLTKPKDRQSFGGRPRGSYRKYQLGKAIRSPFKNTLGIFVYGDKEKINRSSFTRYGTDFILVSRIPPGTRYRTYETGEFIITAECIVPLYIDISFLEPPYAGILQCG